MLSTISILIVSGMLNYLVLDMSSFDDRFFYFIWIGNKYNIL